MNRVPTKMNKKGITLIEVIVACFILVVTVTAILSMIAFSSTMVSKNVVTEGEYAQAEGIADILITALSKGTTSVTDLEQMSGAVKVSSFSPAPNARQFTYTPYNNGGVLGYTIYVRIYDKNGNQTASVTAFASNTGGVLD